MSSPKFTLNEKVTNKLDGNRYVVDSVLESKDTSSAPHMYGLKNTMKFVAEHHLSKDPNAKAYVELTWDLKPVDESDEMWIQFEQHLKGLDNGNAGS